MEKGYFGSQIYTSALYSTKWSTLILQTSTFMCKNTGVIVCSSLHIKVFKSKGGSADQLQINMGMNRFKKTLVNRLPGFHSHSTKTPLNISVISGVTSSAFGTYSLFSLFPRVFFVILQPFYSIHLSSIPTSSTPLQQSRVAVSVGTAGTVKGWREVIPCRHFIRKWMEFVSSLKIQHTTLNSGNIFLKFQRSPGCIGHIVS